MIDAKREALDRTTATVLANLDLTAERHRRADWRALERSAECFPAEDDIGNDASTPHRAR